MNKKFLKKVILPTMLCTLLPMTNAYAAIKNATTTHDTTSIEHFLNVQWQPSDNDNASATSTWTGIGDHSLGVRLYYKDNINSSYVIMGGEMHPTSVTVKGSRKAVWTYKSEHYVYHVNSNGSVTGTSFQTSLTDW